MICTSFLTNEYFFEVLLQWNKKKNFFCDIENIVGIEVITY